MCLCSPYYACNGTCCPAGQFCVNGQCSANDGCQSTDDCDQGLCIRGKCQCRSYRDNCTYFCEMKDQYYGVCSTGAYYEEGAFSMAGTVWSTKTLSWFTASDFCASLGKEMVSLEDLGCVAAGDTYTCTIPSGKIGIVVGLSGLRQARSRGPVWGTTAPSTPCVAKVPAFLLSPLPL